jgi:ABC-2 type transport system ATP-binding protein
MVTVERVTRRFGSVLAVDDVSFRLERDLIVGFVGPNGAGKSTLFKMLATYLYPTSGRILVDGADVVSRPLDVRRRVGYLPGDAPLYRDMRTDRYLAFLARAHGYAGQGLARRLAWVAEACGLADALGKRIRDCSTGYRKRIGLAGALVHDPEVLLLDEPTHGLDPLQVLDFRELLRRLRPGRAILVSSHIVGEVAHVAERLLVIHRGRLLADGSIDELAARAGLARGDLEGLFVRLVRGHEGAPREIRHAG